MLSDYFDLGTFFDTLDTNPKYTRDLLTRAIFGATYSPVQGKIVKDHDGYYVTNFIYPDSEDEFEKKMADPDQRDLMIKYLWANKDGSIARPITYKINEQGFRTPQFNTEGSIVCFGCSYTYGVGLPEEDTWPSILRRHYKIPVCNLGIPGNGLDIIAFYALQWLAIDIQRPLAFCVLIPPAGRIDFLTNVDPDSPPPYNFQIRNLLHQVRLNKNKDSDFLLNSIPMTSYINEIKNLTIIKHVAQRLGIPCIIKHSKNCVPPPDPDDPNNVYARDLMHPGVNWQHGVADAMISELDSLPLNNGKSWLDWATK